MCADPCFAPNLFVLRMWCEDLGDNQCEWRGEITNLHSRETRYFRDAQTLYTALWRTVIQAEEKTVADTDRKQDHTTCATG